MRNSTPMVTSRKRMTISAPTTHSSASPYTARKRCIALPWSAAATDLFSKRNRAVNQFLGARDLIAELIVDRFARRDEGGLVDVVDLHPVLLQLFEQVALVLDRRCVDERLRFARRVLECLAHVGGQRFPLVRAHRQVCRRIHVA